MTATIAAPVCRHCSRPLLRTDRRLLCNPCYYKPAIREQYPLRGYRPDEGNETEEELDRIIAEQRKCLPPWWKQECLTHGVTGGLSAAELRKPIRDPRCRRKTIH